MLRVMAGILAAGSGVVWTRPGATSSLLTIGLGDARFRAKALAAMKQRIKSDQTVVLVSHNADQVQEMCDRVIWIEDGHIQQEGDTREVLEGYRKFIIS